jgi:hypothetical protein
MKKSYINRSLRLVRNLEDCVVKIAVEGSKELFAAEIETYDSDDGKKPSKSWIKEMKQRVVEEIVEDALSGLELGCGDLHSDLLNTLAYELDSDVITEKVMKKLK